MADEVLLLIEVADTSIEVDHQRKAELYGQASISEYWVVNVSEQAIHVFRDPIATGYRTMETIVPGNKVRSQAVPTAEFDPGELFP